MDIEVELLQEHIGELIGFLEEIAGVDAYDRRARRDTVDQMQHHGGGRAKAGRCDQSLAELIGGPLDELFGGRGSERSILFLEVGIDGRDEGGFHDPWE